MILQEDRSEFMDRIREAGKHSHYGITTEMIEIAYYFLNHLLISIPLPTLTIRLPTNRKLDSHAGLEFKWFKEGEMDSVLIITIYQDKLAFQIFEDNDITSIIQDKFSLNDRLIHLLTKFFKSSNI